MTRGFEDPAGIDNQARTNVLEDAWDDSVPQDKENIVVKLCLAMKVIQIGPVWSQRICCLHFDLSFSRNVHHGWWVLRVNTTEMSQKTMNRKAVVMV